jgi:hypothetical protein
VEVAYPFHPLFRQPAIVVADQLHNGSRHLTLRSGDGPSFLVPAWMIDPAAASIKIVDVPRLSLARLVELRAFLDLGLASAVGNEIPEGGGDGEARDEYASGSVRGAVTGHGPCAGPADEGFAAPTNAADGGDGDLGRSAGDGR